MTSPSSVDLPTPCCGQTTRPVLDESGGFETFTIEVL
jgi:hypothetical protein